MKKLLFICGANGVGKTTACKALLKEIENSAYIDSDVCRFMNPFVLNDETIPTIQKNISDMIRNYMDCPAVNIVIFSYGFHGPRKEIFQGVLTDISDIEYEFVPILLACDQEENKRRLRSDGRDENRVKYSIEHSRAVYDNINYPRIDTSNLSVEQTVKAIIQHI